MIPGQRPAMGGGGDGVGHPGAMVPPPMAPGPPGPPMGGAGAPATRPGPGHQRAYPHVPMPQQQYQPPMGQAAPQMMPGMMQQPVGGGAVGMGVVPPVSAVRVTTSPLLSVARIAEPATRSSDAVALIKIMSPGP